jgi:transcriptional regulator with XRE-family HTH domain
MGAVLDFGRKRPNGKKIMELRKQNGLKQEVLAKGAEISVRSLRDIERKNHPVPGTTITAIASVLKVNPSDITQSSSSSQAALGKNQSLLKLKAIQSATELGTLASRASQYGWALRVDPTTQTAPDMQAVMQMVHRLVRGIQWGPDGSRFGLDEYDSEQFGEIPRLARLQELLNLLLTNEVAVLAGTYSFSRLSDENPSPFGPVVTVNVPGEPRRFIETSITLCIRFVASLVNEVVLPVYTGVSTQDFDPAHIAVIDDDEIPF